ncbi:MAG TPA: peptidylprolyl isomerase, partial [Thermoanaerobaculia bacterium]
MMNTVSLLLIVLLFGIVGSSSAQGGSGSANPKVAFDTSKGRIVIELYPDKAPKTVANFLQYVKSGHYNGTVFHRVIPGFMVQGGDPLGTGTGGPGYRFPDEFHPEMRFDRPYLLAMANAGPGTNGSQFFITVEKTPWLTMKHTIFGEVEDTASQDVVEDIAAARTGPRD